MNTTQIKCFLTLAKTLNFTKAAEQLYLSQPGLSRQIVSMERELNTQLFIRDQKSVRLTPAAAMLARELSDVDTILDSLVERAQSIGRGYSGMLTLGTLEGQWMGELFSSQCYAFMARYPNIDLRICQGSFRELRQKLIGGDIDIAMTLKFELAELEGVVSRDYGSDHTVFAVSRKLPLGQKDVITLDDILSETLLIISPEDSPTAAGLLPNELRQAGKHPQAVRYAPNLSTIMLWIEAGLGVGLINSQSHLVGNSSIRLITEVPLGGDAHPCIVWRRDNLNPAVALFDQALTQS